MSVYRYFQKITSIGVYRQTNTYTHDTYTVHTVVKYMKIHKYIRKYTIMKFKKKIQTKYISKWIPTSICLYGGNQWKING